MRFTFARRIGLIVVLSLTVAWIAALSLFYMSGSQGADRPLPRQIVSLVRLLENAKPEEHALILKVINTQLFIARIEQGQRIGATPRQRVPRVTARVLKHLLDEQGG